MTRTDSARLCTRNEALVAVVAVPATLFTVAGFAIATGPYDIFNGLAPIGVAFAAALPGLVRAATWRGAMS